MLRLFKSNTRTSDLQHMHAPAHARTHTLTRAHKHTHMQREKERDRERGRDGKSCLPCRFAKNDMRGHLTNSLQTVSEQMV